MARYKVIVTAYHYDELDNTIGGDYDVQIRAFFPRIAAIIACWKIAIQDRRYYTWYAGCHAKEVINEKSGVRFEKRGWRWRPKLEGEGRKKR